MRRFLTWKYLLITGTAILACTCCLIIPGYVRLQVWQQERIVIGKWKAEYETNGQRVWSERLSIGESGGYGRFRNGPTNSGWFTVEENGKWRIPAGAGNRSE